MTDSKDSTGRTGRQTWLAILIALLVVASFPLTYFIPMATGAKQFSLLKHLHGAVFFAWFGLFAWQAWLVRQGRMRLHREMGMAGAALAGAMLPLGLWQTVAAVEGRIAAGNPLPFEFAFYNLVDIVLFAAFMACAIQQGPRRPDWHRRLAFIAVAGPVGAALSRWVVLLPLPWPYLDMAPNLVGDLILVAIAWHDRRVASRIHPATIIGIVVLLPAHVLGPLIARSEWWNHIAPGLFGFA